jgi:hypothetical protein
MFLTQGYCPPVQIRPGTESLYERGHDGRPPSSAIRGRSPHRPRVPRARPDTLSIKVGIAGRVTAGPKGGAGLG